MCSFTASSTAWRDSELRCSARSLDHQTTFDYNSFNNFLLQISHDVVLFSGKLCADIISERNQVSGLHKCVLVFPRSLTAFPNNGITLKA